MTKAISTDKHNQIIYYLNLGKSLREVASICNVGKSTVSEIKKGKGTTIQSVIKGRPAKLSPQNKQICVHHITSGKIKSAKEVQKVLLDDLGVTVCHNTVCNTLREAGLGSIEKPTKSLLSKKNITARYIFAKQHQYWTINDWRRVIWSDETKINRFTSDGRAWAWIRDGESLQSHHVKQVVKHGGGNIKIWGCMTYFGVGFMCQISQNLTKELYLEILNDELLSTINHYDLDTNNTIFQHDNDPKHTAKVVKEWLSKQSFKTLDWPAQSPDLNPIEHLWSIVKRRLNEYESPPKGMNQLWERVEEIWSKISPETCERLIESMPRRIKAVLEAKGKWTDY